MLIVSLDPTQGEELDKLAELNKILLRYHSPRCGHCIDMEPEWEKVAKDKRLEDADIKVVDANVDIVGNTKHPSAKDVSKKGVPTIYLIQGNKMIEHKGGRDAEDIVTFALDNDKLQAGGKKKYKKRKTKSRRKKKAQKGRTKKKGKNKARKTKRRIKRKTKGKK